MPLNKTDGEPLGDIGRGQVAPLNKWARFGDLFEIAMASARQQLSAKGMMRFEQFGPDDVLVQEYHSISKVVFIFCKRIAGVEQIATYTFELSEKSLAELRAHGEWPEAPSIIQSRRDARLN